MSSEVVILYHFKRDLRLNDNAGLYEALAKASELNKLGRKAYVVPFFIFDTNILLKLNDKQDRRVSFIYHFVRELKNKLFQLGSDLIVFHGDPLEELKKFISSQFSSKTEIHYYANFDDDPYPLKRDRSLNQFFSNRGVKFNLFKDHLIFARNEILSKTQKPYAVFTPYKKAWMEKIKDPFYFNAYPCEKYFSFFKKNLGIQWFPAMEDLAFQSSDISSYLEPKINKLLILSYAQNRNFPSLQGTSRLGVHLRFGTMSPREIVKNAITVSETFVSELIWRDFFAQILYHYPHIVKKSFRENYENINWKFNESEFQLWKEGMTGYPLVDAGMRELFSTGFMHNRVRMVTASFLCKHLLHHWHHGERWFASLLMDYDLASNCGNWQWCAGSGCDAAPYFRIFNPQSQQEKFDPQLDYIKTWVPEYGTSKYPRSMIDHQFARNRALLSYKSGLLKV